MVRLTKGSGAMRFYAFPVVAALAWIAPAAAVLGAAIDLDYRPVTLHPEDETVTRVGRLSWRGGLQISSSDPRFGGLSSLLVSRDGVRMTTLTDKGYWITARLKYDKRGALTGIGGGEIGALRGPGGRSVAGTRQGDSESLARLGGGLVVGLEGDRHRLWAYPADLRPLRRRPYPLAAPRDLASAHINGGLEALAELPDGGLFAVAERFPEPPEDFHAWIFTAGRWRGRRYARHGMFHPVGAAALRPGGLLVLERRFTWIGGLASRVVQLGAAALDSGRVLRGAEIALLDRPLLTENFEGIDTRPGPDGAMLVYLVSDDNFNALQNTLLVMFALEPQSQDP
jgi:hypothetical protein